MHLAFSVSAAALMHGTKPIDALTVILKDLSAPVIIHTNMLCGMQLRDIAALGSAATLPLGGSWGLYWSHEEFDQKGSEPAFKHPKPL